MPQRTVWRKPAIGVRATVHYGAGMTDPSIFPDHRGGAVSFRSHRRPRRHPRTDPGPVRRARPVRIAAAGGRGGERHHCGHCRRALRRWSITCGRFPALPRWRSSIPARTRAPFRRMKVRLKREIVTMGVPGIDPVNGQGAYVDPADWNALISDPDTVVIDTRNAFEVEQGSFARCDRSRHRTVQRFSRVVRCRSRSVARIGQEDRDVLHRRHPLRKGDAPMCARRGSTRSTTSRAAS